MLKHTDYEARLAAMPAEIEHGCTTQDWWSWMLENNNVVHSTGLYMIVENCKFHTEDNPHYNLFFHSLMTEDNRIQVLRLFANTHFEDYHVFRNQLDHRTLASEHWHFVKDIAASESIRTNNPD